MAVFKDVVITGNGPSAISLSYLLAGNIPYCSDESHPTEVLCHRLQTCCNEPLVHQDLQHLSEGLEGRSKNPVSVLFDALLRPEADFGLDFPSVVRWEHHPEQKIGHVVLGKGSAGGSWQKMETSTLTISQGSWMELPGLTIKEWELLRNRDNAEMSGLRQTRATVGAVAEYYKDYVEIMDLRNFFMDYAKVTSITPIGMEQVKTATRDSRCLFDQVELPLWEVRGETEFFGKELEPTEVKPFCFITPHVVLATGNSDQPRKMGVPGEDRPFVLHSLTELEQLLLGSKLPTHLVVVGAGLCAADAIIAAHFHGIHITHVFRRDVEDPELIFNNLPQNMYPEYHKIHQMMADTSGALYSRYKSYPKHRLVQVLPNHTVILEHTTKNDSKVAIDADYVIVLIGTQPDLSFISNCSSELAVKPGEPINCRQNPIAINPYTHEIATYSGIFAMGPLVGDNFVRFVHGGALAISTYLHQKLKAFSHLE